jgi:VIT1/CCC1 family predicted Fe2+/Mn2+ transporter
MVSVPRNVILDLLPAYLAGEASAESRAIIEEFAKSDPQIARIIRTRTLDPETISQKLAAPDSLEMKTMKRVRRSIRRQMLYVAVATASVLMVPLLAMLFTDEVNWSPFDFIVMAILLFGTGLAYVLISKFSERLAYKAAVAVAVLAGLFLIWVNLAVGIIGSEDNPANVPYLGVLLVGLLGTAISRFQPRGMARTMLVTALAQMLVPVLALIFWRPSLDEPPFILGVFMLNAFFAGLFVVSAVLFRHASEK